ncbi:MAG: Response regulator with antiterminator output domain [Frankiales bacterium]|nr:Response regulator with antiterminator output domain [Frankiales bacterium]
MSAERRPRGPSRGTTPAVFALDLRTNTIDSVLLAVAELAVEKTAGTAASVTLMTGSRPSTSASTGAVALELDETQYEQGYGPCLDAVLSRDVMRVTDARTEARWPKFTPVAVAHGILSSMSLPIPVLDSVVAGLNVYAASPHAFGDEDDKELHDLVALGAAAIANMHLYESSKTVLDQMRIAAESRAVIDQARGVLMARHRCTADEAFDMLRLASQSANRKIRDIAREVVDEASGG